MKHKEVNRLFFSKEKDGLINCIYRLTMYCEKNIAKDKIELIAKQHPNYPSLFSMSEILEYLGLKNICIGARAEHLSAIPFPFVVHLLDKNGVFSIVEEANGDWVVRRDSNNKKIKERLKIFSKSGQVQH
jgi:ABC-type bacteriocin/lantibiotic exporter with double-glycine peptidase domain